MPRLPDGTPVADPNKEQRRCEQYLKQIAEALGVSLNNVKDKFKDAPKAFLRDLRDLAKNCQGAVEWAMLSAPSDKVGTFGSSPLPRHKG